MPLKKKKTQKAFDSNVAELIRSWKKTGKIGHAHPRTMAKARKIALAIAYSIKRGGK